MSRVFRVNTFVLLCASLYYFQRPEALGAQRSTLVHNIKRNRVHSRGMGGIPLLRGGGESRV